MLLKLSFHLSVYIYTENICIFLLCGLHLWHTLSFCWAVHHHSKGLGMTISKLTFLISLSAPKHSCQILEWACCFGWPSEHSCFTRQNSLLVLWGASLPSHRLRVACCTQVTQAGLVFMLHPPPRPQWLQSFWHRTKAGWTKATPGIFLELLVGSGAPSW